MGFPICHIRVLLDITCTAIIVTGYYLQTSNNCPCTFDSASLSADCSAQDLQKIPDSHCVPDTTMRLDLSYNDITYQPGQFQRFRHLTNIDLSWNGFFTHDNGSFSSLTQLRILFLNHTRLIGCQPSLFTHLTYLQILSLDGNLLSSLSAPLFKTNPFLTYLDLSGCKITAIENSPFISLHFLRKLLLQYNKKITLNNKTFSGLIKLEELDLSFTKVHNISVGVFDVLTNLRNLNLKRCQLHEIDSYLFFALTNLSDLDLEGNSLNFHSYSFAGLSKLKFLSLTNSWFYNIPDDVFRPLVNIEILYLVSIGRFYFDIDKKLSVLSTLKELYVSNMALGFLKQGFSSLRKLEILSFRQFGYYNISILSNETFKYLKNSPISTLILCGIQTKKILPYTFSVFRNLSSLHLLSLYYKSCPRFLNIETGLQNTCVTYLRLTLETDCTRASRLRLSMLSGLASTLETLDLSGNDGDRYIYSLGPNFFHNLPVSLKYLYLDHNEISELHYCLEPLRNLVAINLSHQKKTTPKDNCMNGTTMDSFLSEINTSVINMTERARMHNLRINQNQCCKFPASLATINISYSGLLCSMKKIICDPANVLKTLDISEQYDTKCFDEIFFLLKNLPKLEILDMSGNHIKRIPMNAFSNLNNLKRLLLAGNALGPVISFYFSSLVLQSLDLSDNSIGYFTHILTEKLETIGKRTKLVVDLSKNNLLCDCDRIAFTGWMRKTKNLFHKDKLVCSSQPNKTVSLSHISELYESLKYTCTVKDVMIGCAVLFVGLHLILCIGYLTWYKRWKLRYLLEVGKKTINPYHPIEDREIELEYDVYITYERDHDITRDQTMHELVSTVIYPALQHLGYKVLIREELEPGVGLYNSISYALRRVKKVVALITRDYCRDYWNVFEFNMAVLEGIYTKRQVLIPVAFEQIGREDLHDEIYAFLKAGSVAYHTHTVTDEMLVDYLCDKIRDNREFGE